MSSYPDWLDRVTKGQQSVQLWAIRPADHRPTPGTGCDSCFVQSVQTGCDAHSVCAGDKAAGASNGPLTFTECRDKE
jgi:hypothetical protein